MANDHSSNAKFVKGTFSYGVISPRGGGFQVMMIDDERGRGFGQ